MDTLLSKDVWDARALGLLYPGFPTSRLNESLNFNIIQGYQDSEVLQALAYMGPYLDST